MREPNVSTSMVRESSRLLPTLVLLLLLGVSAGPILIAQGQTPPDISIHVDWVDADGDDHAEHAYVVEFSSAPDPSDWLVNVTHSDANGTALGSWTYLWGDENHPLDPIDATHYRVLVPTNISFADSIDVEVWMNQSSAPSATRTVVATLWNQPLADHEITVATQWELEHSISNGSDSESYELDFAGQGWQKRTAGVLEHNELGTGTLVINETADDTNMVITLQLTRIWLNETMVGAELESQMFEMVGTGNLVVNTDDEGDNTVITANVVNSYITRSLADGIVSEAMRLEANGMLNISTQDGDEETWINGSLSLLLVEIEDVGDVRVLNNIEFEATAQMHIQTDEGYLDFDLSELISREREENGTMVSQFSRFRGDGSFLFSDTNDENGSIVISGDIIEFYFESQNGNKTADSIHLDGDITGATSGSFGILRSIQSTGETANDTGVSWPINLIHQEVWYNITGGGVLGDLGVGAYYNETHDYEVVYDNYTNRTIRFKWDEQSDDPSQGEEWPPDSPIPPTPQNDTLDESMLGDVNISRETGFAPTELLLGDSLSLYASDLMWLDLVADGYDTFTRDGHVMQVTTWNGTYSGVGTASGSVVNNGILAGLIAEVQREVGFDIGDDEILNFTEVQSLERVISPAIISESENTPPQISDFRLQEGSVVNEGGRLVHVEAVISDPDWNVRTVSVDLSSMGLGTLDLNDIGLDGDSIVHDDIYTGSFVYTGTDAGNLSTPVTVTDSFTSTSDSAATLLVTHRAPRMTDFQMSTDSVHRGENLTVSIQAWDALGVTRTAVDFRSEGGSLVDLADDGGNSWSGTVQIPASLVPGDLRLTVYLEDGAGAWAARQVVHIDGQWVASSGIPDPDSSEVVTTPVPWLHILNEGPAISDFTLYKDGEAVTEIVVPDTGSGSSAYVMTVAVQDPDGVSAVQARLMELAPIGQDLQWQLMTDDGQGADAVAGDGVYSIEVQVREGLPTGSPVELQFRGVDLYVAATNPVVRVEVMLTEPETSVLTDPGKEFLDFSSSTLVILVLVGLLLLGGAVGLGIALRRTDDMEDRWGGE